ncbi:CpXC domain-containing protein [Butyricicoccus sp.]|uniref:CpXC domain-containing protein n=1 Tax=Butyricicoccus sp. TaxID=2049021 RepID=UPI003F1504B3
MSNRHTISFTCPACRRAFTMTQWTNISPDDDPAIRKHVMTGDLFHHTCPHCGKRMMIAYNCLYQDRHKKFAVSLQADRSRPAVTPLLPGYQMRLECTLASFVERIRILDAGLDDMAFELYRTVVLAQVRRQHPERTVTSLRFDAVEGDDIFLQAGQSEQVKLPLSSYQNIADKVKKSGFHPKVSGYLTIHSKWVQQSGILDVLKKQ